MTERADIPAYLQQAVFKDGWLLGCPRIISPNFDPRPVSSREIPLLVVHAISLPPEQFEGNGVVELFSNCLNADEHPYYDTIAQLKVSAHFFIRRDGAVVQFVSADQRAWHAGTSSWRNRSVCNDFSLGIEVEGSDNCPFEEAQYVALAALVNALTKEYGCQAIVGHSDIAPGRKTDPGPYFLWSRLLPALHQALQRF